MWVFFLKSYVCLKQPTLPHPSGVLGFFSGSDFSLCFIFFIILVFAICIQLNWLERNNKNARGPKTLRKPKLYAKLVPTSGFNLN